MNRKYITSGIRVKGFLEVDPVLAPTILIYQSDERYDIIDRYFRLNHFTPIYATKANVKEKLLAFNYDIALLDYFEEPGDLSLLHLARSYKDNLPIIMQVEYDTGGKELEACKANVDLFLFRPYNIEILVYKIKTLAKRCIRVIRELPKNDCVIAGCLLDIDNAGLIRVEDDYFLPLAPVELEIMKLVFAYYKEGSLPKSVVLNRLFGNDKLKAHKKNLDVRINGLRKKLKDMPIEIKPYYDPPYRGYRLSEK